MNDFAKETEFNTLKNDLEGASAEVGKLREHVRMLRDALVFCLNRHVDLVDSGDCGCWDPENDAEVKTARAALAATEPRP